MILGARVLAEFRDDPNRYADPSLARTTPARGQDKASPTNGNSSLSKTQLTDLIQRANWSANATDQHTHRTLTPNIAGHWAADRNRTALMSPAAN